MAAFLLLPAVGLSADLPPSLAKFADKGFPDNADLRGRLFAYVIGASRDVALAYGEKQLQSASAGPVTVRVEKRTNDFVVKFLNANPSAPGAPGRGSCFIERSAGKGSYILRARILLEDDPSCFLDLYPSGSGTRGDVVMYGAVVKKGLYLSDMLYRILLLSFSDLIDATSRSFDWGQVFQFGGKGPDYLAELRSAASSAAQAEPANPASAAPSSIPHGMPARVALASAPPMPVAGSVELAPKGPRTARIAAATDRAASAEALLLELGDTGACELAASPSAALALADADDGLAKASYADFPRYDAKGLPLAAIRSALYLDLLANPDAVYALVGDSLRATVVPYFDDSGRLAFSVFSGGKETTLDELSAGKRDIKVRVLRFPAS